MLMTEHLNFVALGTIDRINSPHQYASCCLPSARTVTIDASLCSCSASKPPFRANPGDAATFIIKPVPFLSSLYVCSESWRCRHFHHQTCSPFVISVCLQSHSSVGLVHSLHTGDHFDGKQIVYNLDLHNF